MVAGDERREVLLRRAVSVSDLTHDIVGSITRWPWRWARR